MIHQTRGRRLPEAQRTPRRQTPGKARLSEERWTFQVGLPRACRRRVLFFAVTTIARFRAVQRERLLGPSGRILRTRQLERLRHEIKRNLGVIGARKDGNVFIYQVDFCIMYYIYWVLAQARTCILKGQGRYASKRPPEAKCNFQHHGVEERVGCFFRGRTTRRELYWDCR